MSVCKFAQLHSIRKHLICSDAEHSEATMAQQCEFLCQWSKLCRPPDKLCMPGWTTKTIQVHIKSLEKSIFTVPSHLLQMSFINFKLSSMMPSVMTWVMYGTFQLYQKPSLAFSLKLISSRVPLCIIHHLTVYLKPCFPVSMRCSWNTWMQATFIICVLLGHLLHFLFLRGMVNSAWLANFQALNNVMIPDMYCMGSIQDILHSAAQKGKIFAKLDCKDAFFQMLMNEDDISKTAITTPLELLEWVVMPHSICNVPSFCIQPMPELGLLTHGLWLCFSLAHGSHVAASHAWVFPILVFFPCHPKHPEIYLDCKSF